MRPQHAGRLTLRYFAAVLLLYATVVLNTRRRSTSIGGGGGKKSSRLPQDKFSVAMDSLHVTAVPKSLPCRNAERNQLLSFLTSNIKAGELVAAEF